VKIPGGEAGAIIATRGPIDGEFATSLATTVTVALSDALTNPCKHLARKNQHHQQCTKRPQHSVVRIETLSSYVNSLGFRSQINLHP
jgi:hypothetical protein